MTWRLGWVCKECTYANENPSEPICEVCSEPVPGTNVILRSTPVRDNVQRPEKAALRKPETDIIEVISLEESDDEAPNQESPTFRPNDYLMASNSNGNRDTSHKSAISFKVIELSDDDETCPVPVSCLVPINESKTAAAANFRKENSPVYKDPSEQQKRPTCSASNKVAAKENNRRKAAKTALNKSRRLGAYFWSEVVVHIPETVWNKYGPFVKESIDLLHGDINVFSLCDRKNWITWERKRLDDDLEPECFDKANNRLILNENCPVLSEIAQFSALFYEAADFIAEYENGQILSRIRSALQTPDARIALVAFDLRRIVRLRANKAMRKQLAQSSTGVCDSTKSTGFSSVGEIDDFAAYLINQFDCRCSFLNFASLGEVGMFLSQTTRHIAQEPYKPDATSSLGFRHQNVMKSAVVGGIFTPAMKEWFNVLIRIPGISPKRAEGVIKRYPSCASLLLAYHNCGSDEERKQMLKDIEVEEKRLGPSVSATVFDYLYSV